MFRFHDAIDPSFHLAGLLLPGRKEQTRQVGTRELEHIFYNHSIEEETKKGKTTRDFNDSSTFFGGNANKAPEIIERATGHKSIEDSRTDVKLKPSAVLRPV